MKWPVTKLLPHVHPIAGETLRYLVNSRSHRGEQWLVDLGAYWGHGRCDCPDFRTRYNPNLREGERPAEHLECWHIKQARRYSAIEVAQVIIAQRQVAADANRKANGKKPERYEAEHPVA